MGILELATTLMAVATFALAWEAKKSRRHEEIRILRTAYRAALREVGENIVQLRGWNPLAESTPTKTWFQYRARFDALARLLDTADINSMVWQRVIAVARNILAAEQFMKDGLVGNKPELAKAYFFNIDIYLVQIGRLVLAEMKNAGLANGEAKAIGDSTYLRPAAWGHGGDMPPETAAHSKEAQPIAPFSELPNEPDGDIYSDGKIETLISEARAIHSELHSFDAVANEPGT